MSRYGVCQRVQWQNCFGDKRGCPYGQPKCSKDSYLVVRDDFWLSWITGQPLLRTLIKSYHACCDSEVLGRFRQAPAHLHNVCACVMYRHRSRTTGFQIPSRPLAIGPLILLWANQVDIKGGPHCECIKAKLSIRTKNIF